MLFAGRISWLTPCEHQGPLRVPSQGPPRGGLRGHLWEGAVQQSRIKWVAVLGQRSIGKGQKGDAAVLGGPREDEVNGIDIFLETKLISEAKAKIDLALFSSLPHPHLT